MIASSQHRFSLLTLLLVHSAVFLGLFTATRIFLLLTNFSGTYLASYRLIFVLAAGVLEDLIVVAFFSSLLLLAAWMFKVGHKADASVFGVVLVFVAAVELVILLFNLVDAAYYSFVKAHIHLYVVQYIQDFQYFFDSAKDIFDYKLALLSGISILIFVGSTFWVIRKINKAKPFLKPGWLPGVGALVLFVSLLMINQNISFDDPIREDLSNNVFVYVGSTLGYLQCSTPILEQRLAKLDQQTLVNDYIRATNPASQKYYFDEDFPLIKTNSHNACLLGLDVGQVCDEDSDNDGFVLDQDCDDQNPNIHPGARERLANGIDENCNGIDDAKQNVILVVLESFGAKYTGYGGASDPQRTPTIDKLAKQGAAYSKFYSSGTTTANSIISALCSVYATSARPIDGDKGPTILCLPHILKQFGYATLEMQAGDLGFLDKRSFFKKIGFQEAIGSSELSGQVVNDWGTTDRILFDEVTKRLDQIDQPFFLTAYTVAVHHPFAYPPDGGPLLYQENDFADRLFNLMHYTDSALGDWLQENKDKQWMQNTILVITSDNSQPIGGKGIFNYTNFLHIYEENVRIPLIITGSSELTGPQTVIASQIDIPPTIIDLLGIDVIDNFRGKSLVKAQNDSSFAYLSSQLGSCSIGIREGEYKYIADLRQRFAELYNINDDPNEAVNLYATKIFDSSDLDDRLFRWHLGNIYLNRQDKVWSEEYQQKLNNLIELQQQ